MKICFIDEAGCTGSLPSATSNIQPVLVITGVIIDYLKLSRATEELINLKQRFFPSISPSNSEYLSCILAEIKGSELRKNACLSAKKQKHAGMPLPSSADPSRAETLPPLDARNRQRVTRHHAYPQIGPE